MNSYLADLNQSLIETVDSRCFWTMLEWIETGEPGEIGYGLYWDPINGFTGDPINIWLFSDLYGDEDGVVRGQKAMAEANPHIWGGSDSLRWGNFLPPPDGFRMEE